MQRDRRLQVFQLLAESVGQAGKALHALPQGQVLALDHARRDKARLEIAEDANGHLLGGMGISAVKQPEIDADRKGQRGHYAKHGDILKLHN